MFRELTRIKQKLSEKECIDILRSSKRGVLSVIGDNGYPYGMPMNHYLADDGCLYFHSGNTGHRLDSLMREPKVSFCTADEGHRDNNEWAYRFKSVIVFGKIEIVDGTDTVADISAKLSRKFTDDEEYIRREIDTHGHRTVLLKLIPENICGKTVLEA